jgi:DNA invertase Pin-like site-specific DNA recombinase
MTSPADQEGACRTFSIGKGWEIVAVFSDLGKSAYKKGSKRPGFDAAMAMIESKQADIFLVWKLDRFYRSGNEFHAAWNRINAVGADFASVMEDYIDTSTAMGRSQLSAIAYHAEIESENRSQRTTLWNNARLARKDGAPSGGGKRPYGYRRDERGTLSIVDDEASIIRIAHGRIVGGESIRKVLRELAPMGTDGITPLSRTGFRRFMISPTTYGLRRDKTTGKLLNGCWEAIIDPKYYGATIALLDNPERLRNVTASVPPHMLSTLLVCGRCDSRMAGRIQKRDSKYRYTCFECGNSIDQLAADAIMADRLMDSVPESIWHAWQTMGHGWDASVRDSINARIDNLDMRYLEGSYATADDIARYNRMRDQLTEQLAQSMSEQPLDLPRCESLRDSWATMSVADQRRIIRQAFATPIRINVANGTRDAGKRIASPVR